MFDKVPFYAQVLIFLAMAAGIVLVAYAVYPNLGQMQDEITKLEDEYAVKADKIREGQAIEQRLPEFEREIEALKQKLGDIQQILPKDEETGDLLAWIKNVGDQSNLDLKSFNPGSLRPVEFYNEFPIEMQVVTRFHDLGLFLDRVSKYSRIINVDNLRISQSRQRDKSISASFTATTFVYDERAAAEEGVAQ